MHAWTNYKRPAKGTSLLANLNEPDAKNATMEDRYQLSKLISLFLARKVARLPAAKDIVVDVVNPGLCVSELRNEMSQSLIGRLLDKIAYSAEDGSKNVRRPAFLTSEPFGYRPGRLLTLSALWRRSRWQASRTSLRELTCRKLMSRS